MTERTKTGLEIVQAAALLGLLGNVMLRQVPWGLNAFVFVTAFVVGLVVLWRRHRPEMLNGTNAALVAAMVFFALMFLVRDSIQLRVFDTFAIIAIMGVIFISSFGIKTRIAGAFHYIAGVIAAGLSSAFGGLLLLGADVDWKSMPGGRLSRNIFAVLRGLAIAMPLLLIFGGLFMAADAVFEAWVNRALNFDIDVVVGHVMLTSALAWLTAGYFRGVLFVPFSGRKPVRPDTSPIPKADASNAGSVVDLESEHPAGSGPLPDNATVLEHINRSDPPEVPQSQPAEQRRDWQNFDNSKLPSVFTLGTVETVIILGLVDLLFLGFVVTQVPYLFGGIELVQSTPDFKLADYARRGFGELVAVAALVLPMLLASHWLLRRETRGPERIFRILGGVQIALLFVIMASAAQRLMLLTGEFGYGMTTARFYPMVLMIWLAVVLSWFAMTVLRGARHHFAWGALWSAITILGATNVINPDDFIARTNIRLMQQGREFDASYYSQLSADAVPALVSALPAMTLEDQCRLKVDLHITYRSLGETNDIRSFNWSRKAAWHLLNRSDAEIHRVDGCPDWVRSNLALDRPSPE
ncbi:MAG: DUF4153 domain-containing protein [Pyrinomonadaceae bacterium]